MGQMPHHSMVLKDALEPKVQKLTLKQNNDMIHMNNIKCNKLKATKAVCNKQRSCSRIAYLIKLRVIKLLLYNK